MSGIDAMIADLRANPVAEREGWELTLTWVGADGTRLTSFRFLADPRRYEVGIDPLREHELVGLEAKVLALTIKEQRDGRIR